MCVSGARLLVKYTYLKAVSFFFLRFVLKFLYSVGVGGKGLLADTMRGGGEAAFKRDALLKDCTWISKVDRGSWWDVVL